MLRPAADPAMAPDLPAPLGRSVRVAEAAAILACDPSTVRKMVRAGLLQGHRVGARGGGLRVTLASIEAHRAGTATAAQPRAPAPATPPLPAAHRAALAELHALGLL